MRLLCLKDLLICSTRRWFQGVHGLFFGLLISSAFSLKTISSSRAHSRTVLSQNIRSSSLDRKLIRSRETTRLLNCCSSQKMPGRFVVHRPPSSTRNTLTSWSSMTQTSSSCQKNDWVSSSQERIAIRMTFAYFCHLLEILFPVQRSSVHFHSQVICHFCPTQS
jgi:hypothetical protein